MSSKKSLTPKIYESAELLVFNVCILDIEEKRCMPNAIDPPKLFLIFACTAHEASINVTSFPMSSMPMNASRSITECMQ